jgi:hypothetical protein
MAKKTDKEKKKLQEIYEVKIKSFEFTDPVSGDKVHLPVCFGSRENNVRKPVPLKEMDENIRKVATCPTCGFLESCSSATTIDFLDQILMFNRLLNGKVDRILQQNAEQVSLFGRIVGMLRKFLEPLAKFLNIPYSESALILEPHPTNPIVVRHKKNVEANTQSD